MSTTREIPDRQSCDRDWTLSPPLPSWAAAVMSKDKRSRYDATACPGGSALKRSLELTLP